MNFFRQARNNAQGFAQQYAIRLHTTNKNSAAWSDACDSSRREADSLVALLVNAPAEYRVGMMETLLESVCDTYYQLESDYLASVRESR
jgi:hypothetical protein